LINKLSIRLKLMKLAQGW